MEANSIVIIHKRRKTAEDNLSLMETIWARGEGKEVSSFGASGGLLTWWEKQRYSLHSSLENRNWIFVELLDKENNDVL